MMQIPMTTAPRPPLELCSIRLYSTGAKGKVFTDRFYTSMNHNFGVEMEIRNNTASPQSLRIGGQVYTVQGTPIIKWIGPKDLVIAARSTHTRDFYVTQDRFAQMTPGKYKIQFWINDKKVMKVFFTIASK